VRVTPLLCGRFRDQLGQSIQHPLVAGREPTRGVERLCDLKRAGKLCAPLFLRRAIRDLFIRNNQIALPLRIAGVGFGEARDDFMLDLVGLYCRAEIPCAI
jgi:hypothetical protein